MAIDPQRSSFPTGPIRVPKSAEVVADLFRKRIITGELKEGDALPPEGALLASLAISRPTLREALRILEAEGLITVVRGSRTGARVHLPKVEGVARYAGFVLQSLGTTIADIYEARLAIEPYVAGRLAIDRPSGATERLHAEAQRLTELVEQERYAEFMGGVADFHRVLIELSGNKTLVFVSQTLHDLVTQWQIGVLKRMAAPVGRSTTQLYVGCPIVLQAH